MTDTPREQNGGTLNPQALRLEDLARILSSAGRQPRSGSELREDIDAGAPCNPDGTMNLLHYAAWMAKEMGNGA